MDIEKKHQISWSENMVIVDGDYIDKVAFDLIVNFERMLERRIPQADIASWIDYVALDGGIRPGNHETQVVFIHDKENTKLENLSPSDYEKELNNKAFSDKLGEFLLTSYPVEPITNQEDFFADVVNIVCKQDQVKRILLIPDMEKETVRRDIVHTLRNADEEKHVTVFTMQPFPGGNFKQEILGYSLMKALGIESEELDNMR